MNSPAVTSCAPRGTTPPPGLPSRDAVLVRAGGENFPVASRILPRPVRQHLWAFYGFARFVDELGDSYEGDRLTALEWVAAELAAAVEEARAGSAPSERHPLVAAAARSSVDVGADPSLLSDLVEANRLDQTKSRYATYAELLDYCRLSANPVGRLVLHTFGAAGSPRDEWSDSICTGLQLVEHWQDVGEDARAGRVYLPADDMARFAVDPGDLSKRAAPAGPAVRALLAFEAVRARELLDSGAPLVSSMHGRARLGIAAFVAGGHAALDGLARGGFDPSVEPRRPAKRRLAWRLLTVLEHARKGRGR